MMRKTGRVVFLLLICAWALSGCHTVRGVGEDIQSGGRAIERTAD